MKKFLNYVLAGLLAIVIAAPLYSQPVTATVYAESVTITQAELEAGSPVQVVAAPDASTILQPIAVTFQYIAGTVPYTAGSSNQPVIGVCWGTNFNAPHADIAFGGSQVGFLDQTVNRTMPAAPAGVFFGASVVDNSVNFAGQPLYFAIDGGAPTGGNGEVAVTITYTKIKAN